MEFQKIFVINTNKPFLLQHKSKSYIQLSVV